MPKKLDPKVAAMLPDIYTREQLEYAKGVVSGEIKVRYFKASDIPEKKEVPEAFKKRHRSTARAKAKTKAKRIIKGAVSDVFAFMATNIDGGLTRQQSIAAAVDKFGVSKHSAGYHFDKAAGKR